MKRHSLHSVLTYKDITKYQWDGKAYRNTGIINISQTFCCMREYSTRVIVLMTSCNSTCLNLMRPLLSPFDQFKPNQNQCLGYEY